MQASLSPTPLLSDLENSHHASNCPNNVLGVFLYPLGSLGQDFFSVAIGGPCVKDPWVCQSWYYSTSGVLFE